MIPRFKPNLDLKELKEVLHWSSMNDVKDFEERFAEFTGQRRALAFPYGRTGLLLMLRAFNFQDKEIICPAYTCVVVAHAITLSGNTPVFVDSSPEDFNMNLDLVERAITPRTAAIIPTSLFGTPVDLEKLNYLRNRYPHLKILQDCCHSFLAARDSRFVHREGDAALFALNFSKLITSIFGGMVTSDDQDFMTKLEKIRNETLSAPSWQKSLRRSLYFAAGQIAFTNLGYRLTSTLINLGLLDTFVRYYDESLIDLPADHLIGMSNVEARVGLQQLSKYQQIISARRLRAVRWRKILENEAGCDLFIPKHVEGSTYSHFPVRTEKKDELRRIWRTRGYELGEVIEYSIPNLKAYRSGLSHDSFPISRQLSLQMVNFPVHEGVSLEALDSLLKRE